MSFISTTAIISRLIGNEIVDRTTAEHARQQTSETRMTVQQLQLRQERSLLVIQAMWEILRDNLGITDQQFLNKVSEIDIRDGVKDGRITPIIQCSNCGQKINRRHKTCIFCETTITERMIVDNAR